MATTQAAATRRRVIVVDDYDDQLEAVRRGLERGGFEVVTASTGREFLRHIISGEHFDAVLMDVNLPGELGTKVAEQTLQMNPQLPIAMLTAYKNVPSITRDAKRIGVPVWDKVEMSNIHTLIDSINGLVSDCQKRGGCR